MVLLLLLLLPTLLCVFPLSPFFPLFLKVEAALPCEDSDNKADDDSFCARDVDCLVPPPEVAPGVATISPSSSPVTSPSSSLAARVRRNPPRPSGTHAGSHEPLLDLVCWTSPSSSLGARVRRNPPLPSGTHAGSQDISIACSCSVDCVIYLSAVDWL